MGLRPFYGNYSMEALAAISLSAFVHVLGILVWGFCIAIGFHIGNKFNSWADGPNPIRQKIDIWKMKNEIRVENYARLRGMLP